MSDMPLNTLVTPPPGGQGPWPAGGSPGTVPTSGTRPAGELARGRSGGTPESGENPFSSLMLGFFQAAQASPSAAGPGTAGSSPAELAGELSPTATASLGEGAEPGSDPGMGVATGNGTGNTLPRGGTALPLPPGMALAGTGTEAATGARGQGLAPTTNRGLPTGTAPGGNPAPSHSSSTHEAAGAMPSPAGASTATMPSPATGELPLDGTGGNTATGNSPIPGAELLAQIRLARSGTGRDEGSSGDSRPGPATGSTPPGLLAPAAGTLARLAGGDLAGNGATMNGAGMTSIGMNGNGMYGTGVDGLMWDSAPGGELSPGSDGELISQFALDAGRRADGGGMLLTGNGGTASPASSGATTGLLNPATGSLPPLPALDDQAAWSRAVGERLMALHGQGLQSARLKLYPEYLGELDVRIQIEEGGQAQVWFQAGHAQAREALEASLPRLKEMFAESGLDLVQARVDSGPGGDGGQGPGYGPGSGAGSDAFGDGFRGHGDGLAGRASPATRGAPTGTGGINGIGAEAFSTRGSGRLNVLA